MLMRVGDSTAWRGPVATRITRGRVAVGASLAAIAIVALTAATAVPSRARTEPAPPPPAPTPAEPAYLGAPADPLPEHPAAEADPDAQRFTGRVGADLSASLAAAGVPERQGREYVWVLSKAIDLAGGLSVDDRFDLVIEKGPDGSFRRLLYAGLDRVARADVELLKWTDGKAIIWVNGDGVGGEQSSAMRLPVSGRVTSGFGSRFHPILGYQRMHNGVDLAASYGTPIVAAADGKVIEAGWHGGYGRLVEIAHANGIRTIYGHMSRIAAAPGAIVRGGQVIGYVGSTGLSTGPHLHYEVMKDGRPVNPLSVKLAAAPAQLQGEKLQAFQGELRKLLSIPSKG